MTADPEPLDVGVLGLLRVVDAAGRDLTPEGLLQRRLLSLLVLRRGEVVNPDEAIDVLWPRKPPRDPNAALQNHVFRLRGLLGDDRIKSAGGGYVLDARLVRVDVDRIADLISGPLDDEGRIELAAALNRWDGAAYPDLVDTDVARVDDVRLVELRTRAIETLAEARLRAGDTAGLVAQLTELADGEPLRERPRSLLMSALAAESRIVDALRVYDDFRRRLGDELGIEPSPSLSRLHNELLGVVSPAMIDLGGRGVPLPPTPLLGRDDVMRELTALTADARVITLVGPGGVGKTRLLVELGHRLAPDGHGVVFCELALADDDSVADVVAAALGVDARIGVASEDRVVDALRNTAVVLLLDNCEHVLGPVASLVELIVRTCASVTIVATSRERLRVPGELVRTVPPLGVGDADPSAIELFVERARDVRPDLNPTSDERACIAEIVRRLDGLPLAIELAAARLYTHELDEIAAGLRDPLTLLSTGFRTSARHSSLTAVIEWSYGLLDADLQRCFDALSVFPRPFTSRDVAAVADLDVSTAEAMLTELVERSLLARTADRRYRGFETLRAFGASRMDASGLAAEVVARHASWMVSWAVDVERRLHAPGDRVIAEVDDAVPELRAAVGWLLDHERSDAAGRIVAALLNYGVLRLRADVLGWAGAVIDSGLDVDDPETARVWAAWSYAAWMAGDVELATSRMTSAMEITERCGVLSQEVATMRGNCDLFEGRLGEAAVWYERAIDASQTGAQRLMATGTRILALGYLGEPQVRALADTALGEIGQVETPLAAYVWYCAGEAEMAFDIGLAHDRLSRAVVVAETTGASFVRGLAGASRASIDARVGDPIAAARDYLWLIPHWRRASMWSTQWTMLRAIVLLLERLGRYHDAAVLEGAVLSTPAGHRIFGADEQHLRDVAERLSRALGDEAHRAARAEGARLDGGAAVDRALDALIQEVGRAPSAPGTHRRGSPPTGA